MALKYFFRIKIKKLDSFCKKILAFLDSRSINNRLFKILLLGESAPRGSLSMPAVWRGSYINLDFF